MTTTLREIWNGRAPSERAIRKPLVLVSLLLAAFVINLDTTIVNVALPSLVRQLHASDSELQWVVDAYNLLFAASVLAAGYIMPMIYFIWSLRYGEVAGANPWGATGLEWQTPSPPPPHNFQETPVVVEDPYSYPSREEV